MSVNNILLIITCKNHIDTLPYAIEHYGHLGTDIFVIDQGSTDGSIECLRRRKIPHAELGPDQSIEEFKSSLICEKKPEWILEALADEFIVFPPSSLRQLTASAAKKGFNQIKSRRLNFYRAGETKEKGHPKDRFYYYLEENHAKGILQRGDSPTNSCLIEAFVLNYQPARHEETRSREALLDIRNLQAVSHFLIMKGDKNNEDEEC